ncbi:tetratricopeptide repeat protein [Acidisoma sp. 7E03]
MDETEDIARLVREAQSARGQDWAKVAALAAELRARAPDGEPGYQIGAASARALGRLDEAAAILAEALLRFPAQAWPLAEQAWLARARADRAEAIRVAATLRTRFPENWTGYHVGAISLREAGRFDEAEAVLAEALTRFPAQAWPCVERAWLARAQGDLEEALRQAAALRERFPDNASGYQIGATSARDLRRFEEAAAILAAALPRFEAQAWPWVERAWLARGQGDLAGAIDHAVELRARFPDHQAGYQIGLASLRELRRFDEADALLGEALRRFPDQAWPDAERAWAALAQGERDAALHLAEALRQRFPAHPTGYQIGLSLLGARGRTAEADRVLAEAKARFSGQPWLERLIVTLARNKRDRSRAERLLQSLEDATAMTWSGAALAPPIAQKTVVVVVGMHRAGTSLCARLVSDLGVALGGPLIAPNFANPDGFQEHRAVLDCHEALLDLHDAAWDTSWLAAPRLEGSAKGAEVAVIRDRLMQIVGEELDKAGGRWAFKDPRTACFLPLWKGIFAEMGVRPVWLLAVRDPRTVAASLSSRDACPLPVGELLWLEHYLNALRHLGPEIAAIIHYEKWFAAPCAQLDALAAAIGDVPAEAVRAAAPSIKAELKRSAPGDGACALSLSATVHAWLAEATAGTRLLQHRAESLWRHLAALAG